MIKPKHACAVSGCSGLSEFHFKDMFFDVDVPLCRAHWCLPILEFLLAEKEQRQKQYQASTGQFGGHVPTVKVEPI